MNLSNRFTDQTDIENKLVDTSGENEEGWAKLG